MEAPRAMRTVDPPSVIWKSLTLLGHNVGLFPLLALIANAPALAYRIATAAPRDMNDPASARAALVSTGIEAGLGVMAHGIAGGAISYGTLRALAGEPVGLGECLRKGLSRALPVIGVSVVSGLVMMLGACACVFPGLYLGAMLFVATPALVAEDLGVGAALKRSQDLTEKGRFSLVGVLLMILAVELLVAGAILMGTYDPVYSQMGGTRTAQIALGAASVLFSALQLVTSTVAYHALTSPEPEREEPPSAYF